MKVNNKQFRDPKLVKYEYFTDDDLLDDSFLEARRDLLKKYSSSVKIKTDKQKNGITYEFKA